MRIGKTRGLIVEKPNSIYQKGEYTSKDVEKNIFANPFKRFADMRFLQRCRDIELIELNRNLFKKLTDSDVKELLEICDIKLSEYYCRH